MEDKKLGAVEARFADLIWDHEPINSTALVRLCAKELDWKKSTETPKASAAASVFAIKSA